MQNIKIKSSHDFATRTKVQACRSLVTGWSLGAIAHTFAWVTPVVVPPERARVEGDWKAVGAYLSKALDRERKTTVAADGD